MIKKIIFDLDNTLIMWKDEYLEALKKTLKKYNNKEDANDINDLIDNYETKYDSYNKEIFLNHINKSIKEKINMEFIEEFFHNIGFMAEQNEEVIDVLEYLSKKYELIVLTNWFTIPQKNRLKTAKIDKYFKEVIGAEQTRKPFKESFLNACGKEKPEECIMIGDNYEIDILGAHNAGLKTIFLNQNNKENKEQFKEIKNLKELKNIL